MNKRPTNLTPSEIAVLNIAMDLKDREYTDLLTPAQLKYIQSWTQFMLRKTTKGE